jgi:hypothetical protein
MEADLARQNRLARASHAFYQVQSAADQTSAQNGVKTRHTCFDI